MKLAFIGANGKIGTELCFLLKDEVDIIPIVRNKLGAVFLNHNGFKCRIADISQENDAKESLNDADVVVISSYAADPFSGSETLASRKINEDLVKNSVRFANEKATVIYFSSIRAFSHNVDNTTSRFWSYPSYDKEKQHLERLVFSECKNRNIRCFALRLGHVLGDHQPFTKQIKKFLSTKKVIVRASPERKSNVLHTVTLKDVILRCMQPEVNPGLYSVVNNPQWTWKCLFEYYNSQKTQIEFKPDIPSPKNTNDILWKILKSFKKYLVPFRYYLPSKFDTSFERKLIMKRIHSAISALNDEESISLVWSGYEPIPGPFLPGLEETSKLLKTYSLNVFN